MDERASVVSGLRPPAMHVSTGRGEIASFKRRLDVDPRSPPINQSERRVSLQWISPKAIFNPETAPFAQFL